MHSYEGGLEQYFDKTLARRVSYKEPLFITEIEFKTNIKKAGAEHKGILNYETLTDDLDTKLRFMFALHEISNDATNMMRLIFKNRDIRYNELSTFTNLKKLPYDVSDMLDMVTSSSSKVINFPFRKTPTDDLSQAADKLFTETKQGETLIVTEHDASKDKTNFLSLWYNFLDSIGGKASLYHFHTQTTITNTLKSSGFQVLSTGNKPYNMEENPTFVFYAVLKKI